MRGVRAPRVESVMDIEHSMAPAARRRSVHRGRSPLAGARRERTRVMVRTRAQLTDAQREKLSAVTAAREARLAAEAEYRRAVAAADQAKVTKSAIAEAAGVSVEAVRTVLIRMAESHAPAVEVREHLTGVDGGSATASTAAGVVVTGAVGAAPVTGDVRQPVAKAS